MNDDTVFRPCREAASIDEALIPKDAALAMAYVPMQCLKNAYSLEKALMAGTLFPELDKPFQAAKGGCNDGR